LVQERTKLVLINAGEDSIDQKQKRTQENELWLFKRGGFNIKGKNILYSDFLKNVHCAVTVGVDVVGQEEVQLPHRDIDVVGVDTEAGVEAVRGLFQPLSIRALQGHSLEQDHLHQV
jgi:hypothetical protein